MCLTQRSLQAVVARQNPTYIDNHPISKKKLPVRMCFMANTRSKAAGSARLMDSASILGSSNFFTTCGTEARLEINFSGDEN